MKREDLRNKIIPTTIGNTDIYQTKEKELFDTTDLIYLDSIEEHRERNKEIMVSATDYALMNNAYQSKSVNCTGKYTTSVWLRSATEEGGVYVLDDQFNEWQSDGCVSLMEGICPSLHYKLPNNIPTQSELPSLGGIQNRKEEVEYEFNIREVKDTRGQTIYHTLQIGEYPKTKVDEDLSATLELLYNGGKIKESLSATGRWYSCNGKGMENSFDSYYAGKHSPEFEYKGNRYVRVIQDRDPCGGSYSDGTRIDVILRGRGKGFGGQRTIRWAKVEPISFMIKNWDEMPQNINPKGTGQAEYFDLRAEDAIIANIPFYPEENVLHSNMWQNSCVRGFLNGIDVRNITQNGAIEYGASKGGNFTGECNFLNEAFNLSRQPMIEYTIPDSEKDIPDDAFNGCITLKKTSNTFWCRYYWKKSF